MVNFLLKKFSNFSNIFVDTILFSRVVKFSLIFSFVFLFIFFAPQNINKANAAACNATGTGTWGGGSDTASFTSCTGSAANGAGTGNRPAATDTVTINAGVALTLAGDVQVAGITVAANTANTTALTLTGFTLTNTGTLVCTVPGANSITTTIAIGTGTLANTGLITLNAAATSKVCSITMSTGTITLGAGITFSGSTPVFNNSGAGTINLNGGTFGSGGTVTINAGTALNIGGTSTLSQAKTFGAVNINSGTLTLGVASVVFGSTTNIADGATLRLGNFAFTQTGALTVGTGTSGTVQVAAAGSTGSYTFSNAITVNAGGTFNLSTGTHAVVLGGTGTITHNGATFNTGTGAITYSGTGAKAFSGSSNMTFGGTMTVLSGRTLTNSKSAGTLTIGALTMASPTATNSFTLATNSVTTVTGALTFTANTKANSQTITLQGTANLNAGSIVGTGAPTSTGSTRILCDTAASGTLTVTGAVSLTGNSTSTGSKYIDMSAGSCNFSVGGTLTLTGGTNATGDSELIMGTGAFTASGNVTFAGTAANGKLTTTGAGVVNLSGTMSGAGTVSINSGTTFNTSGTATLSTTVTLPNLNVLSGTTTLGAVAITISGATNITGALANATSATLKTFSGLVTINSGGSVALTSGTNPAVTFGAGIVASSGAGGINWGTGTTLFNGTQAFTGAANMTFGGSSTISSGFTLTNSNTGVITFSGAVTGGDASSNFATSTGSYTKFGGSVMATGIITPTYTAHTIEYNGGAQSIKNPTTNNHYHLILSGSGAKTLTGITQIMGNFSILGSATATTPFTSVGGNLSTAGTAALTLGANLTVSGTLDIGDNTNASSLVSGNFTLGVTGVTTIYAGSFFNHAGNAAITLGDNLVVTGCLSATTGCSNPSTGTGTIAVNGGVTGSGTITLNGGTFEVRPAAGINFASAVSSANWKFKNLTFSNSTGSSITVTTQNGGTGTIEVTTTLSIGKAGDTGATVLNAGDRTWILSGGGTALAMLDSPGATLTGATSTFKYSSSSSMNIAASTSGGATASYNNLSLIAPGLNPTYTLGTVSGQTLSVGGDMVLGDGASSMTTLGSTYNPTIDVTGNYTSNGNAAFTSTSGTFSVGGNFTNGATFTHNSGTVTLTSASTATVSSTNNMTFNNFTVSGIGAAKTVKFKHHTTNIPIFTFAGTVTFDGASGQILTIDSDDGVNQWLAHFNNAVSPTWVSVQNSGCHAGSADATVDGNSSLNSNNGSCWPGAGITISGVIRLANGSSAYDCSVDNQTVAIRVNGAGSYYGTCTLDTGVFSVSSVAVASAGDVVSLFLDNETYDAVTVTRTADNSSNITGIELWTLHIIARHEDAGPITNANLDQYDSVQDADVPYTVTTNNLTVGDGMRFSIWDGKTYTPGGTITTSVNPTSDPYDGSILVGPGATLNAGANAFSVGGSLFLGYGTFSASSGQTITLTATSTISTNYGGNTLENLVLDGVGGSWNLLDDLTTTGNITVTNGALNVGANTLIVGTGKQLTVGASGTLNGELGNIGLFGSGTAGSRPFIVTGTFNPGTGSVGYSGTSATDIEATTYNNLYLMPAGSPTYTLGTASSQTINVNDLVVGTGTSGHAIQVNQTVYHPVLNITGNFTINDYVGGWTDNGVEVINAKPDGTKNWVHTNFTDCVGVVNLASGTNTPKILMTGDICVAKMNIAASHELDLSSHVMYLAWSGTGASRPFINNGTFTPSTGRVDYSTGGATDIEATTYYDLSVGEYADSSADTYTLIGNTTVQNALTIGNASSTNSDTLSQGASYNLITGAVTVTSRGVWTNTGTGNITLSGGVVNNGVVTIETSGHNSCGTAGADTITITTSDGTTDRAWSGSGTFNIWDVNAIHQTGAGVTANSSTQGTGSTWTFVGCGITISGTVYTNEGVTLLTSGPTVRVKINGAGSYSAVADGSGVYSIPAITASASDVVTVYLDTNGGAKAVLVTRASGSDMTGMNLYQNFVIVRSDDGGALTNTNMDSYDSVNDADVNFTVTTGNLTVLTGNTFYMQSGTYTPGGNITQSATSSFKQVGGTFNGGSGSITINGNFTLTGGTFNSTTGNLTVLSDWTHTAGGTFNHNNGTVLSTGILANTWDVSSNETFYDLNINRGSGFTLTIASGDTLIVTHTFTHSNNSRLGTGTVEVRGSMVATNSNTSPGDATISFLVAGDQTITATNGHMDKLNINKPSGTVSITGNLEVASVTLGSTSILTSTTGTLTVDGNWTNTAGGVFNHNNGTVAITTSTASTWDFNSTETFYNFTLNKVSGWTLTLGASDSMIVLNDYTATDGYMQSPVEVRGNIIYTTNADGGSGAFTLTGSAAQTITVSGSGVLPTGLLTINKTNNSDTVTLASNVTLGGAITVTKGVFSQGASFNIRTAGAFTVSANGTWSNIGTGDIILGGNVANAGTVTISSSNAAQCTDVTDDIVITSTAGTRTWNGAGTYTIRNVNVTNMTDGAITITVYNSTLTSTDWTVGVCGITISGTIYSDEGSTVITSGPTISIKVNGAGSYSAVANGSGVYSVSAVTIGSAGDVITVFVDNATPDGVVVTRAANTSSDITGLNLYQNRVIVRHEDAGPITNANLDQYDSGGDADIPFTVTTSNLTVGSGTKLLVWTGKTFTPGGTVTTTASSIAGNPDGDVLIQASAVVNTGTSTWNIGGDFSNLGTYTVTASQNTYLTATSTGFTVDDGSSEFDGLLFNGIGGSWTMQSNSSPTGNVSVLDGTLNVGTTTLSVAAAKTLTISGSGSTVDGGSGTINLASTATPLSVSAGTFTGSSGTVNFTGNGATIACTGATYNILNFKPSSSTAQVLCTGASQTLTAGTVTVGDSTNAGASGVTNNPAINISGVLTVALNATFTPGTGTITLSGSGTPFVVTGTFTPSTSTFVYSGTSATNITATTYNNLSFSPSSSATYTMPGSTLTLRGDLSIGVNTTVTKGAGTVLFAKGGGGTQTLTSNAINSDLGIIQVSANTGNTTLSSSSSFKATTLTLDTSQNLNIDSDTLTLTGSGSPLVFSGTNTFTSTSSTVAFVSASAVTVPNISYNHLTLAPAAAGSPTYTLSSGTLAVKDLVLGNGANPVTITAATNNPAMDVLGDLTINNNVTYTKGSGVATFKGGTTQGWTDNNSTKQDLGSARISAAVGSGNPSTVNLGSPVKATAVLIDASQTVALNANTLTLTGNTTPFTVTGTLTPNVGTIEFASAATTGTTVPAVTYYDLKLNKSGNTFTVSAGNLIVNGNLDIVAGGLDLNANDPITTVAGATTIAGTLNASSSADFSFGGDFINNGTFTHNNGTVVVAPGSSFTSLLIGGSATSNFYNFTANHSNLAGRNIQFKNGVIFSVAHNLTMAGSSSSGNILIDSDSLGSAWKIFVDTEAVTNLDHLIVRDSHCEVGTKVFDLPSTVSNAGNNDPCWVFVNFGIVQPVEGSGFGTLRSGGGSGRASSQNDNEGGSSGGGQPQGGGGQGGPPGGGGASVIDAVQDITLFSFAWLVRIWNWFTS